MFNTFCWTIIVVIAVVRFAIAAFRYGINARLPLALMSSP
jgi:hypothetical protein